MAVYDDQNEKTGGVDQLDRDSEIDDLEQSYSAPAIRDSERNVSPKYSSKSKKDNADKVDASDLNNAEQKAGSPDSNATDKVGAGFTGDVPENTPAKKGGKVRRFFFGTVRRKATTGILTAGIVGGGFMLGSSSIMLLKLPMLMANIHNATFGNISQNHDRLAENLLSRYIVRQVMPGMASGLCTTTNVSKSCAVAAEGSGQVSKLYNAWRDHKLESKLATKHGIEIIRTGSGTNARFYLKVPGIADNVALLGNNSYKTFNGNVFAEIDQKDRDKVRKAVRVALNGETRFKNRIIYFKTMRLLASKYAIKLCIVSCSTRDAWNDKIADVKGAVNLQKILMMERVIAPNNEALQLIIECGLGGFDCTDMLDADPDGRRMTKYERELSLRLSAYLRTMGVSKYTELLQDADDVRRNGLLSKMVQRVVGPTVTKVAAKFIPVVGWADLITMASVGLSRAGPAVMALTYSLNATIAVTHYATLQTANSELMLGDTDTELIGGVVQSFAQDSLKDQNGAGMESSPLYAIMTGDNSNFATTARTSAFSFASTTASESSSVLKYKCNDPDIIPDPVCPEESFGSDSLSRLSKFISGSSYWFDTVKKELIGPAGVAAEELIREGFDWIYDKVGALLGGVLGWTVDLLLKIDFISTIVDWTVEAIKPAIAAISNWVLSYFVSMLTDNISGARSVNIAIAGGAITAREQGLAEGGKVLSEAEVLAQLDEYNRFETIAFESKPFFERMFDTTDTRSAVSRFAMRAPTSVDSLRSRIASFTMNPFGNTANYLATAATPRATASSVSVYKALGIVPVGYPTTDKVFNPDIENYEEANDCSNPDNARDWANAAPVDTPPEGEDYSADSYFSGQLMPTETNGCMLLDTVVSALGSEFDESFLPKDEPIATDPTDGTTVPTGEWVNPMAGQSYRISSPFGPRSIFGYTFHYGTDLAAPNGVPYTAAAGGEVIFVGQEKWGTNYIHILHKDVNGKDIITEYAHSYRDKIYVNVGDQVESGQVIGLVGDQGNVTGPHLHFGVRDANLSRWSSYIDPAIFMRGQGAPL